MSEGLEILKNKLEIIKKGLEEVGKVKKEEDFDVNEHMMTNQMVNGSLGKFYT